MVHPYAAAGFLVALLPLVATPGASLALLVRQVAEGGRGRAVPALRSPRFRSVGARVTAVVLIALGIRSATA